MPKSEGALIENEKETGLEVSSETVREWISPENLVSKEKRTFQGFEITNSIDGGINSQREVSLVRITEKGVYPQHVHKKSDAVFHVLAGSATFLSGKIKREIKAGERIEVPRNTPHGFDLQHGQALDFVSIQIPPIKDANTGEEDFELLTDLI